MSERWESIFKAVQEACSPDTWSRGVELSRGDAVYCERADRNEALFRIAMRGGLMSRGVTLFLDDDDWECECDSEQHGCEHAAGAVIVWRRRAEAGEQVDRPADQPGRIAYRFSNDAPGRDWCDVLDDYEERAGILEFDFEGFRLDAEAHARREAING